MSLFLQPIKSDLWDDFWHWPKDLEKRTARLAAINVEEDEKNIYVTAEIAGVDKKEIKVEYKDNILTISGEKKTEKEENKKHCYYKEITSGSFERQINVGEVDFEKAQAKYENGILKITLPKIQIAEVEGKLLEIK